jgi:hypothetical protein
MKMSTLSFSGLSSLPRPTLCASQYSQLQQERQYLAQALCEQQCRKERFNRALANTESKIAKAVSKDSPPKVITSLRKSRRSLRGKLSNCDKLEQSILKNLDVVDSRMQELEQLQWCRARSMSLARQSAFNGSLITHATPGGTFEAQQRDMISRLSTGYSIPSQHIFASTDQPWSQQIPRKPVLRPLEYSYIYRHAQFQTPPSARSPSGQDPFDSPTSTVSTYNLSPSTTAPPVYLVPSCVQAEHYAAIAEGVRDLSISGEEVHISSQHNEDRLRSQHSLSAADLESVCRRLRLLGGQKAALRLENKAKKRNSC